MNDLITKKCPYIIDEYKYEENKIPALTLKNVCFIEGILNCDSNYKNESDKDKKPDDENIFKASFKTNKKYVGSIAYRFDKMSKTQMSSEYNFDQCLRGAIVSIDRSNSTHLSASKDGREEIFSRIKNICNNVEDLKKELNKIKANGEIEKNHLLVTLSKELEAKNKSGKRSNFSFATKFCSYADLYLNNENDRYSKYDKVMSSNLDKYITVILTKTKVSKKDYIYDSNKKKSYSNEIEYIKNIYNKYTCIIREIIDGARKEHNNYLLNRNTFDHIVWYLMKG